jgi:hypothetical protein
VDWETIAGFAVVIVSVLLHLERRLARIETDVRWLRDAHQKRREQFDGAH